MMNLIHTPSRAEIQGVIVGGYGSYVALVGQAFIPTDGRAHFARLLFFDVHCAFGILG